MIMCNEPRLLTPKCIIKETDENIIHEARELRSKYFIQSTSFKVLNLYKKQTFGQFNLQPRLWDPITMANFRIHNTDFIKKTNYIHGDVFQIYFTA